MGQAGEIETVYDEYAVSFFLFDPATRQLHFSQFAGLGWKSIDRFNSSQFSGMREQRTGCHAPHERCDRNATEW